MREQSSYSSPHYRSHDFTYSVCPSTGGVAHDSLGSGEGGVLVSTKIRPQYETSATVPELQLHVNHISVTSDP